MRLLESRKGRSVFAFEHSEEYQQTQHKFLAAVESMEPNNIVVRWYPGVVLGASGGPGPAWVSSCQHASPFPHRSCSSQAPTTWTRSCSSATHAAFRRTRRRHATSWVRPASSQHLPAYRRGRSLNTALWT